MERLCELTESCGVDEFTIEEVDGTVLLDHLRPTVAVEGAIGVWLLAGFPRYVILLFVVAVLEVSDDAFF
jgi:hypothetical protein